MNSILLSASRWNLSLEPICFRVNCIHLRGSVFVHVGSAQLCTENGALFYMCSTVEVAWFAQNIGHSCTRVRFHLEWRLGVSSE